MWAARRSRGSSCSAMKAEPSASNRLRSANVAISLRVRRRLAPRTESRDRRRRPSPAIVRRRDPSASHRGARRASGIRPWPRRARAQAERSAPVHRVVTAASDLLIQRRDLRAIAGHNGLGFTLFGDDAGQGRAEGVRRRYRALLFRPPAGREGSGPSSAVGQARIAARVL